jgi:hypothetical protein
MPVPYELIVAEDLNLGVGTATVDMPAGGTATGHQINLSTFGLMTTASWTPGAIAGGASATTTVSVPGCKLGDMAVASYSAALQAGLTISAHVSAADTVTVVIHNTTAGSLTPTAASTVRVIAFVVH